MTFLELAIGFALKISDFKGNIKPHVPLGAQSRYPHFRNCVMIEDEHTPATREKDIISAFMERLKPREPISGFYVM